MKQHHQFCQFCIVLLVITLYLPEVHGNDKPRCTKSFYSTEFNEGLSDSTVVFTIDCSDIDSGPEGEISYTLNAGDKGQFRVDGTTGSVLVKGEADAERLFESTGQLANPYTLNIIVQDGGSPPYSTPVTVFIKVNSINDNIPRLENLPSNVEISETELVGKVVATCVPVDDDVDDSSHGTAFVRIKSGNEANKFVLNHINCDLMLISPLDYETAQSYTLVLEAYDLDPVNPKSSQATLVIDVGDINDFRPACVGYNILREVSEASPVASVLTALDCVDKDKGANGQLEYKINKGDSKLAIADKSSGNVTLVSPLDFENGDSVLEAEILVYDLGVPSLTSTVTVVLKVTDADDNPPEFTKTSYNATVSENTLIGAIVLTVTATDLDTPNTDLSKITYGLDGPCDQDWFLVDSQIGSVVVKNALDWETTSLVTCRVYAYSSDKFDDRNTTNVYIHLTDVNDRAPVFEQFLFSGFIQEDAPLGTSVLKVEADDPDDGINGNFSMSMPEASPFSIHSQTGEVTLTGSIDYENVSSYLLTVIAKDKGSPTQTSLTYLNIRIQPVNEFEPVISGAVSLSLSEHTEPGRSLTKMSAVDGDTGDDGEVVFFLLDDSVPFLLESETGDLRSGIGLDREVEDTYNLTIMVRDESNTTARSSSSFIQVTVTDVNDNAPNCSLVTPITVSHPTSTGTLLTQLTCFDIDLDNTLSYNLVGGNDNDLFEVNSVNGKVTLVKTPIVGNYVLVVDVNDNGSPNLKITMPISIIVETQLKFDNLPATISISESTATFSPIYTVEASGAWAFITKEFVSGNEDYFFTMNPSTGEIRLVHSLDREKKDLYTLQIRALSSQGQVIVSTLIIEVTDSNDNVPLFDETFVHIKVVETLPTPSVLKSITAEDGDEGVNSDIEYSILSGNDEGQFTYENNGDLKLVKGLDFEINSNHRLTLQAKDKGSPPLSSTSLVFIEVVNQDDNPLVVHSSDSGTQITLSEDSAVGTQVAVVNASDPDEKGDIKFSLTSGNDFGFFIINKYNGSIYTATSLDHETVQNLTLIVEAENSAGAMSTVTLDMHILDINDNSPVFSHQYYTVEIDHATPSDVSVGQLTVNDKDSGNYGKVSLSIQSGNDLNHFRLDGVKLETVVTIDSDIQDFYTLIVKAADGGVPSKTSTALFQVTVKEKYKIAEFATSYQDLSFDESQSPGTIFDFDATIAGASEGEEGDLAYTILQGNDKQFFFINSYSGKMDLVKALDYSQASFISLEILAHHRENIRFNDSFVLNITVNQINKHNPKFTQTTYTWSIPEKSPLGTMINPVKATDDDIGQFGEITYTLETNGKFEIDFTTGWIKTVAALDYRHAQSYHFYVIARDKGTTISRSSSAIVIINLEDINDYSPAFDSPTIDIYVSEATVPPQDVYVVVATDEDTGNAGVISYSIISGDTTLLAIDNATGVLQLLSPLDYETTTKHILQIKGEDNGVPSRSSTVTLTLNVNDANDHTPLFPNHRVDLSVPIHASPFTPVYNATATDKDNGVKDSTIIYLIKEGNTNNLFTIDTDTGEIKTGRQLNVGDSTFTLIVTATDKGIPPLTGTTTVGILITPSTASAPSNFTFDVVENQASGTLVGTIPKDQTLTITDYSITSGNYNNDLTITKLSNGDGVIHSNRALDRETYNLYQLLVSIKHTTGVKNVKVVITVTDINDNDPVAEPSNLGIDLVENTPVGTILGKIIATDADSDTTLQYTISNLTPLGQKYFSVDINGVLAVAAELDYEVFPSLSFVVDVRDGASAPRSTSVTVIVSVKNVLETDEPDSTADDIAYSFKALEIPHSMGRGEQVFVVTPEDFEISVGSSQTAKFSSVGTNVFSLDSSSGRVTIAMDSLLYPSSSYLQWMVCTVSNSTSSTSRLAMIRVDTFDVNTNLIAVIVSLTVNDLELQRATLQARLQTYFSPPNVVRIWSIQSTSTANSRRRLLSTQSVALVVVVKDNTTDNLGNVDQSKTFLSQSDVLGLLQADPSGNPVTGLSDSTIPVAHVVPYVDDSSDETEAHPAKIGFLLIIALAALVALILIVALIVYLIKQRKKSKGSFRIDSDKKNLCESSTDQDGDDQTQDPQQRVLMLIGKHYPKQLPPLERNDETDGTDYTGHPFDPYRPPSRPVNTPMGLKRPLPFAPLDTGYANPPFMSFKLPTRAIKTPQGLRRPLPLPPLATAAVPKKPVPVKPIQTKKLLRRKSKPLDIPKSFALTPTTNFYQEFEANLGEIKNKTGERKKMVQSLEEEQIEKSKLFLLNQTIEKKRRVANMKKKRKMSQELRKLQKVKNAWRSPKSSTIDNPNKPLNTEDQVYVRKRSPYEEVFPRPYRDKIYQHLHTIKSPDNDDDSIERRKSVAAPDMGNESKNNEDDNDSDLRRKSFGGFDSPTVDA